MRQLVDPNYKIPLLKPDRDKARILVNAEPMKEKEGLTVAILRVRELPDNKREIYVLTKDNQVFVLYVSGLGYEHWLEFVQAANNAGHNHPSTVWCGLNTERRTVRQDQKYTVWTFEAGDRVRLKGDTDKINTAIGELARRFDALDQLEAKKVKDRDAVLAVEKRWMGL